MQHLNLKHFVLMLGFLSPSLWCSAYVNQNTDHYSNINIKETQVQGAPKTNSIQASINGHVLAVVFLENLGQVAVEVTTANGDEYYGEFEVTD